MQFVYWRENMKVMKNWKVVNTNDVLADRIRISLVKNTHIH